MRFKFLVVLLIGLFPFTLAAQSSAPNLSKESRKHIVDAIADMLSDRYVFAATAKRAVNPITKPIEKQ